MLPSFSSFFFLFLSLLSADARVDCTHSHRENPTQSKKQETHKEEEEEEDDEGVVGQNEKKLISE